MRHFLTAIVLIVNSIESEKDHISGACHAELFFGDTPCDKQWSIRYHMDVDTETCLAFNYTGCGSNWNNFESSLACYEACLPVDHNKCPAASKAHESEKGKPYCNGNNECGVGKYCDIGNGYGQCCELEYKHKVDSDYNPMCPKGQSVLQEKVNGITVQLLGKKCSHNFCPLASTCFDALSPRCTLKLQSDTANNETCGEETSLKLHFDITTGFCMHFRTNRCSGALFDSLEKCVATCLKEPYKGCPFQRNPVIPLNCAIHSDCNRKSANTSSLYCTSQGICCKRKDLDELRSAFQVKCPVGRRKVEYTYKGSMRLLIGKSCDSRICSVNATCYQEKYFAFCCE